MRTLLFVGITLLALAALAGPTLAGDLNPPGPPGSTMKTLDQFTPTWDQALPSNDGGSEWCSSSRFKCVLVGSAVLDKETGLVWERSEGIAPTDWGSALSLCTTTTIGWRKGWRLPTIEELASLIDPWVSSPGPTLPPGHPFTGVAATFYWSATSHPTITGDAWTAYLGNGAVIARGKYESFSVLCVRGGHGSANQ